MTAETLSSKVSSVMKGAFNNEEAIGPLAVAKQLHRHYSCKSRSACREIQRERHAGTLLHVGEMWDLLMYAVKCASFTALLQILIGSR